VNTGNRSDASPHPALSPAPPTAPVPEDLHGEREQRSGDRPQYQPHVVQSDAREIGWPQPPALMRALSVAVPTFSTAEV
jgi:hypothetical protein